MPLVSGSRLGHFEIVSALGAGAMGEVYRAKDSRLGREVAIKVLPAHFADDEERLKRFEREAKTLASLNHPNVAQIFGVDQIGETCFLVLELVEGESLEERLKRGPLPLDEALDVCRQIAEGLEAAHEAGVIHRDLKPANVRLTPDGKVKVLDFGLAKPARDAKDGASSTDSVLSTEAGRLLGTPTYMAPEQARGKPIDKRVDVWAFGCVLYECLTAQRAFAGDTLTDVLDAVLHAEPDLTRLPPATPRRVRELLARCLDKDPRRRLRDLGEARLVLQAGDAETASPPAARTVGAGARLAVVVLVLGVAAAAWWLGRGSPAPSSSPLMHLELALAPAERLGPTMDFKRPYTRAIALTPDGQTLVFAGEAGGTTQLYRRRFDAAEVVALPGTRGASQPFLSPDGSWVGYLAEGEIRKTPVAGGAVAKVARLEDGGLTSPNPNVTAAKDFYGASWGEDDGIVFGRYADGLWEVPAVGGVPRRLTAKSASAHRLPRILPGGRGILLTLVDVPEDSRTVDCVGVVPRAGGEPRTLVEDAADGRFVAPDRLLFVRDGVLMSVAFELASLTVKGAPVALFSDVLQAKEGQRQATETLEACFDVSASGTLVYAEGGTYPSLPMRLVWVGRDGSVQPLPTPVGNWTRPRLSPDGRRIAVSHHELSEHQDVDSITVIDLQRGTSGRVTDHFGWAPMWSADGTQLIFGAGTNEVWSVLADGSAKPQLLIPHWREEIRPSSVTADGSTLVVIGFTPERGSDILLFHPGQDTEPQPWLATPANEAWAELSPDGRWLAYGSDASGQFEVYVQPFPGPGPRQQVSVDGGSSPLWSHDGKELAWARRAPQSRTLELWSAEVTAGAPLGLGVPRELTQGNFERIGGVTAMDITPDGSKFLMVEYLDDPDDSTTRLHVLLNWVASLGAATAAH